MKYVYSLFVGELQSLFLEKIFLTCPPLRGVTRETFYKFLSSEECQKLLRKIALDISTELGFGDLFMIQKVPTPRIFEAGSHGTSFHTDHWYGHGKNSFTIWVPLKNLCEENSVFFVHSDLNESLSSLLLESLNDSDLERKLLSQSIAALPPSNHAVVFPSTHLHGSPKNKSGLTRYSLDFRISPGRVLCDTSSKDPQGYHIVERGICLSSSSKFENLRFLKYICGGVGQDTTAQHLLIESVARVRSINIVAQEAEIEGRNFPVFKNYLNGDYKEKKINACIVSSKSLFDENSLELARESGAIVYCALENIFLGGLDAI